jgi:hypothetical protein
MLVKSFFAIILVKISLSRPLMAEVIEAHIRYHIVGENGAAGDEQARAAGDLNSALGAYLDNCDKFINL